MTFALFGSQSANGNLEFCYTSDKTIMKRQYKKTSYDKNSETKQTGVMCSWFNSTNSKIFELNVDNGTIEHTIETHSFLSVKSYLCTLSRGYFEFMDCREASSSKIFTLDAGRIALMTAHKVTLTTTAIDHITTLCVSDDQQSQKASIIDISTDLKKCAGSR